MEDNYFNNVWIKVHAKEVRKDINFWLTFES